MTAGGLALGLAWGALAVWAAWGHRPPPRAVRRRLAGARPELRRAGEPAALVGRAVLRLVAVAVPPAAAAVATVDVRRLGRALVAAAVAALALRPALAIPVGALAWALPALGVRRRRAHAAAEVRRHLPEVVDLLALAVGAGLTVPLAIAAVARRAPGPVGPELARVVAETTSGRRLGDALAALPARLGEDARPLAAALLASERTGAPLGEGLERLAGELRADRRRRAEAAARKVPVTLLFPLVCCILPAFALLTVAPLLAGALRALRP